MRFRNVFLGIGALLVILILMLTDPSTGAVRQLPFGAGALATLVTLFVAILYVGFLHISRKGLLDYIDVQVFFEKALETPQGAGLALIAVGLYTIAFSIVVFAAVR
jgi:hypothetical protein